MGYDIKRLAAITQIRTTDRGWWIVTYPRNPDAILILKNPVKKARFLKDCKAESAGEITDIPLKYYRLASSRVYRHE